MFVYETPSTNNIGLSQNRSIMVYNFHNVWSQQRFFFFINNRDFFKNEKPTTKFKNKSFSIFSIAEIFINANWLEREVAELHSIFFSYKKDLRNLLLPYGDSSAPMMKSFPSIGTREIFYDTMTDSLIQNPISIQF